MAAQGALCDAETRDLLTGIQENHFLSEGGKGEKKSGELTLPDIVQPVPPSLPAAESTDDLIEEYDFMVDEDYDYGNALSDDEDFDKIFATNEDNASSKVLDKGKSFDDLVESNLDLRRADGDVCDVQSNCPEIVINADVKTKVEDKDGDAKKDCPETDISKETKTKVAQKISDRKMDCRSKTINEEQRHNEKAEDKDSTKDNAPTKAVVEKLGNSEPASKDNFEKPKAKVDPEDNNKPMKVREDNEEKNGGKHIVAAKVQTKELERVEPKETQKEENIIHAKDEVTETKKSELCEEDTLGKNICTEDDIKEDVMDADASNEVKPEKIVSVEEDVIAASDASHDTAEREMKEDAGHQEKAGEGHQEKAGEGHQEKAEDGHQAKAGEGHQKKAEESHQEKDGDDHQEKAGEGHQEKEDADHQEKRDADHQEKEDADHQEKRDADHQEKEDADHQEKKDADHQEKAEVQENACPERDVGARVADSLSEARLILERFEKRYSSSRSVQEARNVLEKVTGVTMETLEDKQKRLEEEEEVEKREEGEDVQEEKEAEEVEGKVDNETENKSESKDTETESKSMDAKTETESEDMKSFKPESERKEERMETIEAASERSSTVADMANPEQEGKHGQSTTLDENIDDITDLLKNAQNIMQKFNKYDEEEEIAAKDDVAENIATDYNNGAKTKQKRKRSKKKKKKGSDSSTNQGEENEVTDDIVDDVTDSATDVNDLLPGVLDTIAQARAAIERSKTRSSKTTSTDDVSKLVSDVTQKVEELDRDAVMRTATATLDKVNADPELGKRKLGHGKTATSGAAEAKIGHTHVSGPEVGHCSEVGHGAGGEFVHLTETYGRLVALQKQVFVMQSAVGKMAAALEQTDLVLGETIRDVMGKLHPG